MNYVILDKETEEMIDLINLSIVEKIKYEKDHPDYFLEEASEEDVLYLLDDDNFDDGDWEEDDDEDCKI